MLRAAVVTALSLMLVRTMALAEESRPDFAGRLPARVGKWTKPDKPTLYSGDTLYSYIDGGSELHLAFDFAGAVTFEYAAGEDDTIKVDIFDMGSPRGAFGAFAHGRETSTVRRNGSAALPATRWKTGFRMSMLPSPHRPCVPP